jgi:hypothetical protein
METITLEVHEFLSDCKCTTVFNILLLSASLGKHDYNTLLYNEQSHGYKSALRPKVLGKCHIWLVRMWGKAFF